SGGSTDDGGGGGGEGDLDLLRDDDGKSDGGGEDGDDADGGNRVSCLGQRTIAELLVSVESSFGESSSVGSESKSESDE
ncbi:hypothetical protein Tco_0180257, partial [Tanacetum coccineum]